MSTDDSITHSAELFTDAEGIVTCPVCKSVVDVLVEFPCGHKVCEASCGLALIKQAKCHCGAKVTEPVNLRRVAACQSVLEDEQVACPKECGWSGRRGELAAHSSKCPKSGANCPLCSFYFISASLLEAHRSKTCTKRPVACTACGEVCTFEALAEHDKACTKKALCKPAGGNPGEWMAYVQAIEKKCDSQAHLLATLGDRIRHLEMVRPSSGSVVSVSAPTSSLSSTMVPSVQTTSSLISHSGVMPVTRPLHGHALGYRVNTLLSFAVAHPQRGDILDVLDKGSQWYFAEIWAVDATRPAVFVHYIGWRSTYDEYIEWGSSRLANFRTKCTDRELMERRGGYQLQSEMAGYWQSKIGIGYACCGALDRACSVCGSAV